MNKEFLTTLRQIVGPDQVQVELQGRAVAGLSVGASCTPKSEDEIAEVLRCAATFKVPVFPYGSGTAMAYGNRSPEEGLLLYLNRMNQMLDFQPADMVATAQAGMTIGAFQEELGKQGQWLPLDVPPEATLGGILATDRSGPRRIHYGTLRDMVLGMKVVNGDGVIRKCGGKVVKNVTGYALEKMYIGSLGTLGVMTEVTVKVCPKPEATAVYELSTNNVKVGFAKMRTLVNDWPFAFAAACFSEDHVAAAIGVEGSEIDGQRLAGELKAAATENNWELRELVDVPMDGSCWHALPRPWPQQANGQNNRELAVRLDWLVKASVFEGQLELLEKTTREAGFTAVRSFFEFQSRVTVELFSAPDQDVALVAQGLDAVLKALRAEDIAASVVWKRSGVKNIENAFGPPRVDWGLMQKIKQALDPKGILNPKRFIAGLD